MDSPIQLVSHALRQRGLEYTYSANGYAYEGKLSVRGQLIKLRLTLVDDTFVDLPHVQILERPKSMPKNVPHVSADGLVCYAAQGTIALDIYDPVGQTLACLDLAIEILGSAISGELNSDLTEEFFAYWTGEVALADVTLSSQDSIKTLFCLNARSGEPMLVLTNDDKRTREKLFATFFKLDERDADVRVFKTDHIPTVRQSNWPPTTVGEFLSWQGELDPNCAKRIKESLISDMRKKRRCSVILVQSPAAWYGILTTFVRLPTSKKLSDRMNIFPALFASEIKPLSIHRIDSDYLASRNVPGKATLKGLRIAVVGCGAIGGHLSDLLVRAGAGFGGGKLAIVDPDVFTPGNLGRHRLGLHAIYQPKAIVMAEELRRVMPDVQVVSYPVDVREVVGLEQFDFIVDCTGEEALSNFLNAKFRGEHFVPMIFSWVAGAGNSVNVLIRDTKDAACYLCVTNSQDKIPKKQGSIVFAGYGCEHLFTPYSASVSVSAAALALDAILDCVNHAPLPKYRVQLMTANNDAIKQNESISYTQVQGCPACNW